MINIYFPYKNTFNTQCMIPRAGSVVNSQIGFIYIFSFFTFLELAFFGLTMYFTTEVVIEYPFVVYGASLLLGNFFLMEAIIARNIYQMCIYPFIYTYTLTVNLTNITHLNNISFAFHLMLISVIAIHGVFFIMKFRDFFYEFSWYYYKKIGGRPEIIGKYLVLIRGE